jgi:cell wall-associated NlpC family hydrolase
MFVNVPVMDLRAQPHTAARSGLHDPLQETQLLYAERVRVRAVRRGWARVEAVEQPEFTHAKRWQGYPGWVPMTVLTPPVRSWAPTIVVTQPWAAAWQDPERVRPSPWRLPMGAYLPAAPAGEAGWRVSLLDGTTVWMDYAAAQELAVIRGSASPARRAAVLEAAERLVGSAYFWGGRSPMDEREAAPTGVDCSALVNLAYRTVGLEIPRDAHEQSLRARRIRRVQPADLLFLSARGDPNRIVHVMLYAGGDDILEGPGTGQAVRRIRLAARLGRPLEQLAPGDVIEGQTISYGTYFP